MPRVASMSPSYSALVRIVLSRVRVVRANPWRSPAQANLRVLAYPWDPNPYLALLYNQLADLGVDTVAVQWIPQCGSLSLALALIVLRPTGCRILHIHWQQFGLLRSFPRLSPVTNLVLGVATLGLATLLGYQVIWTAHNVYPHESSSCWDRLLTRVLLAASSAVICLSGATRNTISSSGTLFPQSPGKLRVIPVGNYKDIYPPTTLDQRDARAALGLDSDCRTLLFFGQIRPYKGVLQLIESFQRSQPPGVQLLVAGACPDALLREEILASAVRCSRIHVVPRYIPPEDVGTYFKAADVMCLPFQSITASSSAILAASFAVPILAPRVGSLQDIPEEAGWWFERSGAPALEQALSQVASAPHDELCRKRVAILGYADTLDWRCIASDTLTVYRSVCGHPPMNRALDG
jgi:beta-1,4-mannosyltransferase